MYLKYFFLRVLFNLIMYNIQLAISISAVLEKYELCKTYISFELSSLGVERRPAAGRKLVYYCNPSGLSASLF